MPKMIRIRTTCRAATAVSGTRKTSEHASLGRKKKVAGDKEANGNARLVDAAETRQTHVRRPRGVQLRLF
eukprot:6176935-Pleurochrysis_carterae.AAC.1